MRSEGDTSQTYSLTITALALIDNRIEMSSPWRQSMFTGTFLRMNAKNRRTSTRSSGLGCSLVVKTGVDPVTRPFQVGNYGLGGTGRNASDLSMTGWFPRMVATFPRIWRSCCHRLVGSRRGRGVARSRPNVASSWSSENADRVSTPLLARSARHGPREGTGRTATGPTALVRWWGSCRRWTGSRSVRSALGSCPRTSGSRSQICIAPA